MTLKPWTLALICLCLLLLGVLLGRQSTAHPQNTITVDVEDGSSKINLSPQKNDVIKWVDQANHAVKVKFLTDSPCRESEGSTDTCTIKVEKGNFQYLCDGSARESTTCVDPGVDPRSYSGTLLGGATVLTPPSPEGFVTASISCPDPNAPAVVTWSPDPPGSSVKVNENIVWKGGSLDFNVTGFNHQNTQVQLCSQSTIDAGHRTCTVRDPGQPLPYAVTFTVATLGTNACHPTSATLTVTP